ncbi:MAG: FAD-dependent monooxygenase [Methylocapsa sp.]|nr:FAD-dependent monooxygenase [Methylocapsa sp.]
MRPADAAIAGAGIGGLCTALALARKGWRVSLYEKAQFLEEAGAGLQLSPNASAILQKLGVAGRLSAFALHPKAITVRRARDGAILTALPLGEAEQRWRAPYLAVHRADLQRALLEAAAAEPAIRLMTGAEITGFERDGETVLAAFVQGAVVSKVTASCLIGADGVRSFVRQRLGFGSAKPSGLVAWRALVDAARVPSAMRQNEIALWLGRGAHLVHYPLRDGTAINVVAVVHDDWRGSADDFWSSPGEGFLLQAHFQGWDEAPKKLLRAAAGWRKWPLFDCPPLANWVCGRIALVGDAAHPILPFLAQGAAQAIEDADALGAALDQNQDIKGGLAAYQQARQARALRVQKESRRQAAIYHLPGPAALVRDCILRAIDGQRMLARYDWLYGA